MGSAAPPSGPGVRRGRRNTDWIFNLGADVYAWFTAQDAWRASCARLAAHLPEGPDLRVVDLGCGPGVSTIELVRLRPDLHLAGLDLASRMLAQARRRSRSADLGDRPILWIQADAVQLPFRSGSVDALTGHSFLYLLPDRPSALRECHRVLRPGGRLVLMEPHAQSTSARQVLGVSRDVRHLISVGLWRPFSQWHGQFTRASLAETLEAAGFEDVGVEEAVGGLGLMAWAVRP